MIKRFGLAAIAIAAVIGLKFYNKTNSQLSVKERLVELCATDQSCLTDLDQYYDECFNGNYRMARHSSGLQQEGFLNCLNSRSGKQHFGLTAH